MESIHIIILLVGGMLAGFASGYAGFGMGLVSAGFWFYVLPANLVPPLIVLTTIIAQLVSLVTIRPTFNWPQAKPYLAGGLVGVIPGVLLLAIASATAIKLVVGVFLLLYCCWQLLVLLRKKHTASIGQYGGRTADFSIGFGGGLLGGFAGLPGPLPLVWLQLRGENSLYNRAIYQPFNIIILVFTAAVLLLSDQLGSPVLRTTLVVTPAVVVGAWAGAKLYGKSDEVLFKKVILLLLLGSSCTLISTSL